MGASILRLKSVIQLTGLSRSSIYSLIAKGEFPKQIKLTKRSSGWVLQEVEHWVNDRVAERDSEAA